MGTFKLNLLEQGRATEWLTSLVLLGIAVVLSLPGDTLASPSFRSFKDLGLDEAMVSTPIALLGSARLVALYINGNWRKSPEMRMIGAVCGASIFAMISMALLWPTFTHGHAVSTGASTYLVLALFDALAAYRSGADVRVVKRFPHPA